MSSGSGPPTPPHSNGTLRRLVAVGLVLVAIMVSAALWHLAAAGRDAPPALAAVGGAAVSALAFVIAGESRRNGPP